MSFDFSELGQLQQADTSLNVIYAKGPKRFTAYMRKFCRPVILHFD